MDGFYGNPLHGMMTARDVCVADAWSDGFTDGHASRLPVSMATACVWIGGSIQVRSIDLCNFISYPRQNKR